MTDSEPIEDCPFCDGSHRSIRALLHSHTPEDLGLTRSDDDRRYA
jgi:hypothetical protein